MAGSIVCGVDGSPDSQAAVEVAAQFADRLGSSLILAHVAEVAHVPYAAAYPFGGTGGPVLMAEPCRPSPIRSRMRRPTMRRQRR